MQSPRRVLRARQIQLQVAAIISALTVLGGWAQPATTEMPFRDPDLPIERRLDDLISRLTIEEKIGQTMMGTPEIKRLGIPRYDWWNEALHGVARNGTATVFPQAIGLAATWNPDLHQRIADAISTEARAKNNELIAQSGGNTKRYQGLTLWSPNINIFRDPRWGRGQETYGEDPFLTGQFTVAFVRGLQGNDPRYLKTVATVKHFAVHSGPEPERHRFDAVVSGRDLRETYLPAFEAGIREGGATSLMSAYNAVNGVPAPASTMLLQNILRDEWGFEGAVVGDVDNVADIWRDNGHKYAQDAAAASALALKTGNDLCSGTTYAALADALQRGLVTEADIDQALRRLFALRFKLGQFDPPERVPYRSISISANNSPGHDQLALEAARQSLVLLKNDGTLPWDARKLRTVAVLGPTADEESALLGNYSGTPSRKITLATGIKTTLEAKGVKVLVEPGVPLVKGFRMSGKPFPAGVLFTDADRRQPGLKGEVFAHEKQDSKNIQLEGKATATRTDAQVDLQWDEAQPVEGIPTSYASVRWTGVIVPPKSGEYVLGIVAEGAVRLFIDGERIIDSWRKDPERPMSTTLQLEAGKPCHVRLEYAQLTPKGRIQFGWIIPGEDDALERALVAARQADHIVLTLGLTPDLEGESMNVTAEGFKGGDRLTLQLPATQRELLEKVSALKKPTVVVMTTGSAISFDPDQANAVLLCWYYGQRGADAVAEALLGECNPAGRLPITFYREDSDLPPFESYAMTNRTYRFFAGKPLYPFGHGLSYTAFKYTKVSVSKATAKGGESFHVRAAVKNAGKIDGDEVVQVYATALKPSVAMPIKQLVGFQRVALKAGETRNVDISIPVRLLRHWSETDNRYVTDPGDYRIAVGSSSDNLKWKGIVKVSHGRGQLVER
jgi:beta-glucosidase